jgi:hypothetical protein
MRRLIAGVPLGLSALEFQLPMLSLSASNSLICRVVHLPGRIRMRESE